MEQELQTRSRQSLSGPQIFHLIANFIGSLGGNLFDQPQQLPFPCNTFFLESCRQGDEANTLVMYFNRLGYAQGTSFTTGLKGTEQLFYLNSGLAGVPMYRAVLRFKEPVLSFFLGVGTENGVASCYTIGCTNDEEMEIQGGLYT